MVRVDANRDFDLNNDDDKEIPILDAAPSNLEELPAFALGVTYASGGAAFRPFRFFARRAPQAGGVPPIYYVGWEGRSDGSFVIGNVECRISITDLTADLWWTVDDLRSDAALTVREKRDGKWLTVEATISRIPLAGRFFRLSHVHDDGQMVKLEPISSP